MVGCGCSRRTFIGISISNRFGTIRLSGSRSGRRGEAAGVDLAVSSTERFFLELLRRTAETSAETRQRLRGRPRWGLKVRSTLGESDADQLRHPRLLHRHPVELVGGDLPRKERRLVEAWAEMHLGEPMENWERLQGGKPPFKVASLR